jgi:hypothetical protein
MDSEQGEIRVQASPAWEAAEVTIFFWFVRNDAETTFEGLAPTSGPRTQSRPRTRAASPAPRRHRGRCVLPGRAQPIARPGSQRTRTDAQQVDRGGSPRNDRRDTRARSGHDACASSFRVSRCNRRRIGRSIPRRASEPTATMINNAEARAS